MHIVNSVQSFLNKHNIFAASGIVVAVSAGIDSMVLLHVLHALKLRLVIAHVNHGKREASAEEENFLRQFCKNLGLEIEVLKLNPEAEMPAGSNFQAWARQKRYAFFADVAKKHNCQFIATAHHATDKAETFFIHALRGSGLTGLTSLQAQKGKIIRPLLDVSRKEIEAFAKAENLVWREDASNQTDDYLRNRVRHHVLPALGLVDEKWPTGLAKTQENLKAEKLLLRFFVADWKAKNVIIEGDLWRISIDALQKTPSPVSLLRHLLFDVDAALPFENMADCATDETGSFYIGKTHLALKNRVELLVEPMKVSNLETVEISANAREILTPLHLSFFNQKKPNTFRLTDLNLTKADCLLDFEMLDFPLEMRPWQAGDTFMPLGMKGFKKISDYLIDEKVARTEKEKTFVLTSNGSIVWLIGHRIDERFKVGERTQIMYLGRLHNK